nr:MAG TPA: hypothetical protein [Caudoviricetes sp.]
MKWVCCNGDGVTYICDVEPIRNWNKIKSYFKE